MCVNIVVAMMGAKRQCPAQCRTSNGRHARAAETIVGDKSVVVALGGVGRRGDADGLAAEGDGVLLDGLHAHPAVDKVEGRDGEAVDDDGEDDEEVDCGREGAQQVVVLLVRLAQLGDEVARVLDVEDGADADGAEVAHEEGVLPAGDDAGHGLVGEEDGGDAAEQEDHEAEGEEAADGDAGAVGVVEVGPRYHGADVHEAAEVEEHVDAAVDLVVAPLELLGELAVPVEGAAGRGAGQEVVGADGAAGAHEEEADGGGEQHVGLVVDPFPAIAISQHKYFSLQIFILGYGRVPPFLFLLTS